jgi:hypothetical protein
MSRDHAILSSRRFSDIGTGTWRDVSYAVLVSMATPAGKRLVHSPAWLPACLTCRSIVWRAGYVTSADCQFFSLCSLCAAVLFSWQADVDSGFAPSRRNVGGQLLQRHAPGALPAAAHTPPLPNRADTQCT